ncbi:prolyl 4-hydroxylase subunit alpha-1-like [Drosophila serrata]|uniref:prolyl 4-hydroxylase subunit alpha-1-like n=1 Tax=Drosophila serrata TaxID=7274 RepID=UPI000A1D39A1|nr:prolyl 4-hydroxylase subunit alpha-1-like [Drosophila serrata]
MGQWLSAVAILFSLGYFFVAAIADPAYDESRERYSSSTVGLLKLLKLEQKFVEILLTQDPHGESETIQAYLFSIDYKKSRTPEETLEYVSNPLSAFSLVRRTHEDLPKWHQRFQKEMKLADTMVLDDLLAKVPDSQDFLEAALGIQRIERIYDLRIDDLATGRLQNKQYSIRFTFHDRVAMGNLMFKQHDFLAAAKWYRMATKLNPIENREILHTVLGDPSGYLKRQCIKALFVYGSVLTGDSQSNDEALAKVEEKIANMDEEVLDDLLTNLKKPDNDIELEKQLYETKITPTAFERGCRGQFRPRTRLTCRYNFTTTPFLRLAPLKMEEISRNPYIVMYHDVLYDSEIKTIKGQSDGLKNGFADVKNESMIRDIVARHVWWTAESPVKERINQRIIDMTGLNISRTENIQIANYGLGTYFKPHFDYTSDGYVPPDVSTLGDRLVTILFYASDVSQGGATVFPDLKISIYPQKGSAIWWFNLYNNGTTDTRSKHSVCPVINGDRWTLTMWINLFPQMFIAPCNI